MMPAAARAKSTTASSPTREPVWDMAALAPARLRPVFRAMIGFVRATRAAVARNNRPLLMPSRCKTMMRVSGSSARYSRTSTTSRVAGIAHVDGLAQSPGEGRGPHLEGPGLGHHGEGSRRRVPGNVDKGGGKAGKGVATPMVLGPSTLTPYSRARRTSSACSSAPRASASAKPWLITTSRWLMPCSAHSTAVSTTRSRPKEMTARSQISRQVGHPGVGLVAHNVRHLGMHQVNAPGIAVAHQHFQVVVGPGTGLSARCR